MQSSTPYRDNPGRGTPGVDYELRDYYDDIPAPHRFSAVHQSPYPSNSSLTNLPVSDTQPRGSYSPQALPTSSTADLTAPTMSAPRAYRNLERPADAWMEKPSSGSKRSKWVVIGSVVGILGLIAVGVAVGITVSNNNKKSGSLATSSGNSSSPVAQTDPNDPSSFVKNPAYKHSFYGLAYTPANSQLPNCGNSLSDIITDIQIMSQLTSRIRLYGADCNQTQLVLEAIKETKVNMTVYVANYPIATDGGTAYTRQQGELQQAIQAYGTSNIAGMTVGNEFMLDYLDAQGGGDDPNGSVGNQGAQILIGDINDAKQMLSSININMAIGTADAGAYFNTEVLQNVQYGMANVHPWFANVSIAQAAAWTYEFFQTNNVQPAALLSNTPQMSIAETGWPTNATDAGDMTNGPSVASEANLQTFLDTFICASNQNGTEYFFFETFDEPWKTVQFGGVEGYWGMFYSNKTLKGITLPDCEID